jgi:predicted XRE-type DNA-binding protein
MDHPGRVRPQIEAQNRLERSALSKREIVHRLGSSPAQYYRLMDQKNNRKSIDQMLALLHVLDCDVDLTSDQNRH